jgi:hypothetical protein
MDSSEDDKKERTTYEWLDMDYEGTMIMYNPYEATVQFCLSGRKIAVHSLWAKYWATARADSAKSRRALPRGVDRKKKVFLARNIRWFAQNAYRFPTDKFSVKKCCTRPQEKRIARLRWIMNRQ